jgi:[ribosomal protein S5]-alanine N-acetyltransferase
MKTIPTLYSPRLQITIFEPRHLTDQYVGWLNDPDTVRYSEQRHTNHTIESCANYIKSLSNDVETFCAIESGSFGHIGNLTITRDLPNKTADMAIVIGHPEAKGMGLGAEAWGTVMQYLFGHEGIRKITAGTMATNTSMLQVMHTNSMKQEGSRIAHFLVDGMEVDLIQFAAFLKDAKL